MAIRLYLDEDVHQFIADALRLRGWDALTTHEAGRRRADDLQQIEFAASIGRTIVSYNSSDFPRLHDEIIGRSDSHAGIIVGTQDDSSRNFRALLNILNTLSADEIRDQLLYLNNWG